MKYRQSELCILTLKVNYLTMYVNNEVPKPHIKFYKVLLYDLLRITASFVFILILLCPRAFASRGHIHVLSKNIAPRILARISHSYPIWTPANQMNLPFSGRSSPFRSI